MYFKFRFGTDSSVNNYEGWYIDDFTIKNGATTTNYVNGVEAATTGSGGTTAFDGIIRKSYEAGAVTRSISAAAGIVAKV